MNRDDTLRMIHGMRLFLPPTWEDSSIYRFNAPPCDADAAGGGLRLQPTVLITRHERRQADTPERFLELTNLDAKQADPTYEVRHQGTIIYLDQGATWQDATFTDPRTSAEVHQRR